MYSIGCDLHSKRAQLCLVDDDPSHAGYPLPPEAIVLEGEIAADRESVGQWLEEAERVAPGPKALAVETTGYWQRTADATPKNLTLRTLHRRTRGSAT